MKVLIIPSWYPEGEDRLMGIYHKEYAYALAKSGVEVDMLHISRQSIRRPIKYLLKKNVIIDKEENYNVYKGKILETKKLNNKLFMSLYYKKLEKLYKYYIKHNSKPDILHAEVTIPAGYAVAKLGKKYNIPVVITEHSSGFMDYFNGIDKEYSMYALNNSYFTTVSNMMKKQLEVISDKCDILPNIVETDKFKVKRKDDNNKFELISVCALRKGKGIEIIIKAVKILVDKGYKNVHLNVVGDGYLMDFYKETARELNIDKHISFLGQKTKEEIIKLLSENNIFVVGSRYETFCIPGVEALASGMPIVSTKCGGIEEYLDKKCGELCEVGNAEDMASKIELVYKNKDKYDIKYLRSVSDKFSYDSVCNKAMEIYKKILGKN